jgi:tetratricopeptide (TPR) repeat protein
MHRFFFLRLWLSCVFLAAAYAAQMPSALADNNALEKALQLAKAHRYREAASVIRGLPEPRDLKQRMTFFRLRASIESGLGNSNAAAADMEAAAKLAPDNPRLRAAASVARLEAQLDAHLNPAATLQSLRTVELPADRRLELRLHMGEVLSRAHLYREAATDLAEAARLAPDHADIFFNLALAHYYNGQWDAALESANRAKALEDSGSTEGLLGDIHEKRGDSLEAVHSYQAAVALEPNIEQHRLALAMELLRHQTFEAAILVLEQAASLFPQSVHVKVLLGLSYYVVDRSADAVHTLLEATRLKNDDDVAIRYLGEIILQDTAAPDPTALATLCSFADSHTLNKVANALCGGGLLRAAQETGDASRRDEILHRLRESARVAPNEPHARCQLGKALEWSKQWSEARAQLEACVRLRPAWPEGHYRLARVYRRLGQTSLASQQTKLQEQAANDESEDSIRRANTVSRFLVLFDSSEKF